MHKDDVFGFDVTMQDTVPMHEGHCFKEIPNDEGSTLLTEFLTVCDDVVKLTIRAQLQDGVERFLISEEAVGLDDVGVVQESLDLQLSDELHE